DLGAVLRLGHDLDVGLGFDHHDEAAAEERVVIGDEDTDPVEAGRGYVRHETSWRATVRLPRRFDAAEVYVVATVYHGRPAGAGTAEKEEIVPEEVHLENR